MPALQTTYSTMMRPALAGMIADMTPRQVLSRVVQTSAGVTMGFGTVAVQGTGDLQVRRCADATTAPFIGITVADQTIVHADPATTADAYEDKDICAVLAQGTIWVTVGAAVTAGQPAYYVPATGVITNVTTSNTAIPNAYFATSAGSGALAKLHIR